MYMKNKCTIIKMCKMEKLWNGKWDSECTKAMQVMMILIVIVTVTYHGQKNTSNQEKTSYSDFPPKKPFHAQNSFSGLYLAICLETDFPHKRDKSKRGLRMDESRHYNSKNVGDNKSFALGTLPLLRDCHTLLFDIHCMYWQYERHFFYISTIAMPFFILL